MQVKLLRAIQEKAIRPVGSQHEIPVDVRILSASHKNLDALVHAGQFRQDLYYRINVIDLTVPPLRDRAEDIPALATEMIAALCRKSGIEPMPQLSADATAALQGYAFPGNIRELENILERAIALAENNLIEKSDLSLGSAIATARPSHLTPPVATDAPLDLEGQERSSIMQALEKTRWNKTAAAKLLGLSLRQLRYRLQKFGID
jgi:two-component system response regulator PilR (NtrC family)